MQRLSSPRVIYMLQSIRPMGKEETPTSFLTMEAFTVILGAT